jgi:hypothetical protein
VKEKHAVGGGKTTLLKAISIIMFSNCEEILKNGENFRISPG